MISFKKGNVVCAQSYKKAKKFYSLAEASILIEQVVRQSYFESHLLTDFLSPLPVHTVWHLYYFSSKLKLNSEIL
jgi:hypothetical protein